MTCAKHKKALIPLFAICSNGKGFMGDDACDCDVEHGPGQEVRTLHEPGCTGVKCDFCEHADQASPDDPYNCAKHGLFLGNGGCPVCNSDVENMPLERIYARYQTLGAEVLEAEAEESAEFQILETKGETPKRLKRFTRALEKTAAKLKKQLQAYDSWSATSKRRIFVDKEELHQIINDALNEAADAYPGASEVKGLERYRLLENAAQGVLSELVESKVLIREVEFGNTPLCIDCREEL
jgi:hypothetical protein